MAASSPVQPPSVVLRMLLCLLILGAGAGGFILLKKFKKPPPHKPRQEQALAVSLIEARPRTVTIHLSGYGQIRSRTLVALAAEVSGRVIGLRQPLEPGCLVDKGEILVRLDERDARLERDTSAARLHLLEQTLALARKDFLRKKRLLEEKKTGSRAEVDRAEQAMLTIQEQMQQQRQILARARLHLERCTIRAPFAGRITEVAVETDAYATPGKKLLTLADDKALELTVSLESAEALAWLPFTGQAAPQANWFPPLRPVHCTLTWTGNPEIGGSGTLDRIVRLDRQTRTLEVAIRLDAHPDGSIPLAAGMFCRATIPARSLEQVFTLPRQAVTFAHTVYLSKNQRLQSQAVHVVWEQDNSVIIDRGLHRGDLVITNRLDHPLPGTRLRILSTPDLHP